MSNILGAYHNSDLFIKTESLLLWIQRFFDPLLYVEEMIAADAGFANEALGEVFAEAGGMGDGEPNVFIEVKHFDAVPLDARSGGEELEEVELRSAGGGNEADGFGFGEDALKGFGGVLGGGRADFGFAG